MTHGGGLSSAEAAEGLRRYGPNALPEAPAEPLWRRFFRQFASPLIYVLLFALTVDIGLWVSEGATGLPLESIAIGTILLLNALLGVWQERKAEQALAKLKSLAAPQVWAVRDGALARVSSSEVVPGDLLRLEAGDRVPADGVARSAENCAVDESVLTGESMPVNKGAEAETFSGTLVVRGKVYVEVTRTGADSAMGRLATMLGQVETEPTPLQRRMEAFGNRVAGWVLALAVLIAATRVAAEGWAHLGPALLFAVALAVAAVPEGLPAVLTLTLALGVERMARRNAVVRKLDAVEALGSVTVIATDKTGTLTENRMEVKGLVTPDETRARFAMALANDAEPGTAVGDPLEIALLHEVAAHGVDPDAARAACPRMSGRPFDSEWKFMRVTACEDGRQVTYVKGAPEVVLGRCRLDAGERQRWCDEVGGYASEGYRLLALAWAEGERESDLTWLGLVLLWDPPRAEVPGAVRLAQDAGIRVVMITGDHPATAATVARTIGIDDVRTVTGDEIDGLSEAGLREVACRASVFARVTPEHKLRLVGALKAAGEIVAMTGDGVNDAPALKRSDVGIAMGQRGSDVTREVADLVLLDDNFATIVAAVEEGRSIYENIQKFIRFLFSTNLSEVAVVALGFLGAFALNLHDAAGNLLVPLTAAQLLWINLVTDGAPALALGVDRNPGVMSRAPRDPASPLLDRPSLRFVVWTGLLKACIAFGILGTLTWSGEHARVCQSALFLFMAAGQLVFAYPARQTTLRPPANRILHGSVAAGFLVQASVMFVPGLMAAFDAVPLSGAIWGLVAAGIVIAWAIAMAAGRLIWARERRSPAVRPPAASRSPSAWNENGARASSP
jgi:Ca2+-transporting ATPase